VDVVFRLSPVNSTAGLSAFRAEIEVFWGFAFAAAAVELCVFVFESFVVGSEVSVARSGSVELAEGKAWEG
jgi:hypothetical protein